jgi:hypothetical protein
MFLAFIIAHRVKIQGRGCSDFCLKGQGFSKKIAQRFNYIEFYYIFIYKFFENFPGKEGS